MESPPLSVTLPPQLATLPVMDDAGNAITLKTPAKRIVVLSPDLTEMLFSIGAGSQIVGVVSGSDYPAAARKIPLVGVFNRLNVETVQSLHPDLIVTWKAARFSPQLKTLSVPIYVSYPEKISDIPRAMRRLGCLTGKSVQAEREANYFEKTVQFLSSQVSTQKKVSVFYQVWPKPLITLSAKSWVNEMISVCGGQNSFASLKGAAPFINGEAVVSKNPDVILGNHLEYWKTFHNMKAVSRRHVFETNPDWIERAGPRVLKGMEMICSAFDKVRQNENDR